MIREQDNPYITFIWRKIMARKPRKYICEICGKEFESRSINPKSCSKKCKSQIYKKIYNEKYREIRKKIKCDYCKKEMVRVQSQIKNNNFCSTRCYDEWQKIDGKEQMKIRNKISNSLKGVSLRKRGYSEESIKKWVNAGVRAASEFCKGKKLEEIVGLEKANEIKQHKSEIYSGKGNPFYGKKHTIDTKNKIVKNRRMNGYIYSNGYFSEILWQSSYELSYLIYCFENNIEIKRFDIEPIEYYYQNKKHHYFPDFIQNNELIIECKGWVNGKELAKRRAATYIHSDKYKVIDSKKLNELKILPPKKEVWKWYKKQKLKYSSELNIVYSPHKQLKGFVENE